MGEPVKGLLRFLTCGSVDDGKSTLIGRLLHDSALIFDDQLAALAEQSGRRGSTAGELDFALLVDGLEAEREQGITIDVAHRYFTTSKRSFIVLDTPGHEQYTRNMVTGASHADLAVLLVDARKGILGQTRRHSFICSLLGLRGVVLAVNKIDLVGYDQAVFDRIVTEYKTAAAPLGFSSIVAIPMSARHGDNVAHASNTTPWYRGPSLLEYLEAVDISGESGDEPFRFPVQWVNRPNLDFRGYAGTVAAGSVRRGDPIVVAGSGRASTIVDLLTYQGSQPSARAGDAVTMTLADELDISRGDVLVDPSQRPEVSDAFAAHVIWMSERALIVGRSYLARIATRMIPITVTAIEHRIDVNTGEHVGTETLGLNEIGFCNLAVTAPVAFDAYALNRKTGAFILIDRLTNETIGAGTIAFGLRRRANVSWQETLVRKAERALQKQQKATIIWLTGLSGAGKSTIANLVEQQLHFAGYHTMLLDGDNLRHGLNRDLGFTEPDRVENIRRAGEVAKLFVEAGLIVLCSFISPYAAERDMVRRLVPDDEFIEVFVDTPIEECIRRDPKGLYTKAKAGLITNLTGFDAPYEAPLNPEIHLRTVGQRPEQLADRVLKEMTRLGILQ
jgi:bifunctional enzyme CysN/CysC